MKNKLKYELVHVDIKMVYFTFLRKLKQMLVSSYLISWLIQKRRGAGGVSTHWFKHVVMCYEIDTLIVNNETSSFVEMQKMVSIA